MGFNWGTPDPWTPSIGIKDCLVLVYLPRALTDEEKNQQSGNQTGKSYHQSKTTSLRLMH